VIAAVMKFSLTAHPAYLVDGNASQPVELAGMKNYLRNWNQYEA
jgi:hypothetical protein